MTHGADHPPAGRHDSVPPPRLIAWELTRACPLHCRHCRASAGAPRNELELSTDECRRVIDSIAAFARPILILTGGEPMLRDDLYDIAAHARTRELPVALAVCGLLLDDDSARRIAESGIRRISVSIDGATPATHDAVRGQAGAFEKALAGIASARKAGLDVQVNTTVSRRNLAELPAIRALAVRVGASVWNPFLLVPTGRGREIADEELSAAQYEHTLRALAEQQDRTDIRLRVTCAPHYQRVLLQSDRRPRAAAEQAMPGPRGCLGGKTFAFISHVGKVQICGFLEAECGDLRREGYDFARIWRTSPVLSAVRDVDGYHGRCGRCEFRRVCGGCRARAFAATGDYLAEEPYCAYSPPADR